MFVKRTIRVSALLAGTLLYAALACAQGKVEVAGYGGGVTITEGGTNALLGGTLGVRAIAGLRIFGDFSYSPLGSAADTVAGVAGATSGLNIAVSGKLYNYGGGVDYSFTKSKVAPYAICEIGGGRFAFNASTTVGGRPVSVNVSENMAFVGLGGGVRIYAGENWGVKPEFRYRHYENSDSKSNSAFFTVGLFYQFGK